MMQDVNLAIVVSRNYFGQLHLRRRKKLYNMFGFFSVEYRKAWN